jgi:hypothetical protein
MAATRQPPVEPITPAPAPAQGPAPTPAAPPGVQPGPMVPNVPHPDQVGVPPPAPVPPNPGRAPSPEPNPAQPAERRPGEIAPPAQPGPNDQPPPAASFNPDRMHEFFERLSAERRLGNQGLLAEVVSVLPEPYGNAASTLAITRNTGALDARLAGLLDALPPRDLASVVRQVGDRRITSAAQLSAFLNELFARR